jgi:hypothetical protein
MMKTNSDPLAGRLPFMARRRDLPESGVTLRFDWVYLFAAGSQSLKN